jgi:phosphatidylglycerophosphate synthase
VTVILLLLLSRPIEVLQRPGVIALCVVVGLTLASGADYFIRFWREVVRAPQRGPSTTDGGEG